ncbi:MAG: adenosylmethionine decarboxylase [bacterium]|nr:adenosylmethionine decarboxylase [bacterium]
MYGPHLMLDCYGSPKSILADVSFLYEVLDELPGIIGMRKIMPPYVFRYDSKDIPEDWGLSGVVLIAESHIAIHTYPEKEYFTVDIFSCKEFDLDLAKRYLTEKFKVKKYEFHHIDRGLEFPRSTPKV